MSTSLERLTNAYEEPANQWIDLFKSVSDETSLYLDRRFPTKSEYKYIDPNPSLQKGFALPPAPLAP